MQSNNTDYRSLLRSTYSTRCARNPRYSMRAYARDLGIAPSRLSEVLSGKAGLSRRNALKIGERMGFSPDEREHFSDLVDSLHARSQTQRDLARIRLTHRKPATTGFKQLELDAFQLISGWHHIAILELTHLSSFVPRADWIARALGIPTTEAALALDRLARLRLIERKGRGSKLRIRLTGAGNSVMLPPGQSSAAIREFHSQILQKALAALEFQGIDERDFANLVVAFKKERLPEVRERLKTFRRELSRDLGADPGKDALYCLSTQFFKLGIF